MTNNDGTRPTIEQLITRFDLEPLPVEGGLFRQWWRSGVELTPETYRQTNELKPAGTAIVALLTAEPDSFSAMHRLVTDELWHFYLGDPLEVLVLEPGTTGRLVRLGPDVMNGHEPFVAVTAGSWMGARVYGDGEWCLFGCTMAPGFTSSDFELGDTVTLSEQWPEYIDRIASLSRSDEPTHMPPGL